MEAVTRGGSETSAVGNPLLVVSSLVGVNPLEVKSPLVVVCHIVAMTYPERNWRIGEVEYMYRESKWIKRPCE